MNYNYFKSLTLRDQVIYLVGLIRYWNTLGVNDEVSITQELLLNTNNDPTVIKLLKIIFNK